MTNKKRKIVAIILFLIFSGLLIYNLLNPYQKQSSHKDDSKISTSYDSGNSYSQTSTLSEDVMAEEQPSQEDLWREKYRGNSLQNGAQPYRALYGKNKQSGASEIIVTAPKDQDVLVMVKNNKGKVMRHAYIKSRKTYTFHISAGYYQVFFICGSDWCPEKEAPNGQMGFFLSSSTSKDEVLYIDNYQTLTYTLQSMTNGNFMPTYASSDDAF